MFQCVSSPPVTSRAALTTYTRDAALLAQEVRLTAQSRQPCGESHAQEKIGKKKLSAEWSRFCSQLAGSRRRLVEGTFLPRQQTFRHLAAKRSFDDLRHILGKPCAKQRP